MQAVFRATRVQLMQAVFRATRVEAKTLFVKNSFLSNTT